MLFRSGVQIVALSFAVAFSAHAGGTFCVPPAGCVASSVDQLRIAPAEVERRGVWIAEDLSRVAVFVVAPRQHELTVPVQTIPIRYQLSTRRLARGAAAVDFSLTDAERGTWTWSLPGRAARGEIHVPEGSYTLAVTATHSRTWSVSGLRTHDGKGVDAGLIELRPKLTVEGRVVDENGAPIAGAELFGSGGRRLAATTIDGAFRIDEPADELPAMILLRAASYASREIVIPDRRAALDAGTIFLDRGVSLSVKVTFAGTSKEDVPEKVIVKLRRPSTSAVTIAEEPLRPDSTATLTGLAAGKHLLLVEGPEPMQRHGEIVDLAAKHTTHEITISPVALSGNVYFGAEPLAGGTIEIAPKNNTWNVLRTLGPDGEFGGTLWQRGTFGGLVEGGVLRTPFIDDVEIASGEIVWDIIIPNRSFGGTVTDAATGKGIAGARVQYQSVGTRMRASSFVTTDTAGRYEITGVQAGSLELRARADGYLPSDSTKATIESSAASSELSFALRAGSLVRVRIVDDAGNPIAGAVVVEDIERGGMWSVRHETPASGEVAIPVDRDHPKRLYVVPREGSFATAILRASDMQPVSVVIPSSSGALVIKAQSEDQAPMSNVRFLVRYNGELLPESFWTLVQYFQGFDLTTDGAGTARHPRLPPGVYELWPYRDSAEGRAMFRNPEVQAPSARVGLSAGDQQAVTLTFASRTF